MEVKDILKNRRIQLNLTMKDVAEKVGVSEGTISRWESGEIANMRRDKIMTLANALEISPAVIMGWDSPEPAPTATSLSADEESLIDDYRVLNDTGKQKAREYVSDLTENARYTYEPSLLAAHKRTDIDPDPEGDAADIALVMKLAKESNGGS